MHLYVHGRNGPLIEWWDLPDEPLALTGEWSEQRARALAECVGVQLVAASGQVTVRVR